MSDASSTLTLKLNSTGDWQALVDAKAKAEDLRASIEAVRATLEAFGVSLGLTGLAEFARSINEAGAATVRLAEQAHVSVAAFQALTYASLETGMKQDQLAQKLEFLNKSMGLAAEGSSKQNAAIADLGLNTAELLAMPVEQQVTAIAKAYVNASDKTRAWADVIVLLGRGAAEAQQLIQKLGTSGLPERPGWMASPADLDVLHKTTEEFGKILFFVENIAQRTAAGLFGGNPNMMGAGLQWMQDQGEKGAAATNPIQAAPGGFSNKPGDLDNPIQSAGADPVEAQRKAILAAIAASPEMIEAQQKLTEAIQGTNAAYEDLDQKAARLRAESASEMAQSKALAASNEFDQAAQVKAVDLHTDAVKKLAQANAAEAEADKQYIKDTITLANEDYATERKLGELKVQNLETEEKAREKMVAVALAGIEHNWNETDNQKWADKKALLEADVAALQAYIDKQNAIANNPLLPTEVSAKARGAAASASNTLQGVQGQLGNMGPDPTSFTQNFSADLTKLQSQWGSLQQSMASGLTGVINTGLTSVESNITKLIQGTETWRKALLNIVTSIEGSVVSAFVQMGVKWIATQVMMAVEGKATAAASAAAMLPIAMAESEIWAAPAALATIASWGGAAIAAPELVLASMAATQALAGFAAGGFTGGSEGDFAGIVHGGEYVFSAPAVRNIGVDNLERAHAMAKQPSASQAASTGTGASGDVHIFHFNDQQSAMRAALRHPGTRKIVADIASGVVRRMG